MEGTIRHRAMDSLQRTRQQQQSAPRTSTPIPHITTRSLPSTPAKHHDNLNRTRPSRVTSTLTTAADFTSVIQFAKAGLQKGLLDSHHEQTELHRDQLELQQAQLDFAKEKHADEMRVAHSKLRLKRRYIAIQEHRFGIRRFKNGSTRVGAKGAKAFKAKKKGTKT